MEKERGMDLKSLSDHKLLEIYLRGNEDAISVLIERHKKRVRDYINMIVKDSDVADDIFQETFIKVIRFLKEGRYTESGRFLSWVLRIAHNQVIDYFRQNKQLNTVNETSAGYDIMNNKNLTDTNIEEKLVLTQIQDDIRKLVDLLPEEQREVVMLRYFNGLSFKEIADQTNVSINTALGRMRYALINLRKMAEEKKIILSAI